MSKLKSFITLFKSDITILPNVDTKNTINIEQLIKYKMGKSNYLKIITTSKLKDIQTKIFSHNFIK